MLTAAKAWVGAAQIRCHGIAGGCEQLPRPCHDFVGEEIGGSGSLRPPKLLVRQAVMEGAVTPPPKAAVFSKGVEGDAGLCIRYSRKRKKPDSRSPEVKGDEGSGKGGTETEAEKGGDVGSAIAGPPYLVCSDCGTSRTPLWRRGPAGPKSLCNACGIRYRKARRRAGGDTPNAAAPNSRGDDGQRVDPRASIDTTVSLPSTADAGEARKSENKLGRRERRQREVLWLLLEESRKFELPCGKDAVEAAVLLMALSSGLFVRSC